MRLYPLLALAAVAVAALPAMAQDSPASGPGAQAEPQGQPSVQGSASAGISTPEPVVADQFRQRVPPIELNLRSPGIGEDGIPLKYSEYGEGISPPLSWDPPPAGTRSLLLIVEDPDTGGPVPFVHWSLYGIPPSMTELAEGIADDLEQDGVGAVGMRQGQNSKGTVGYFGMQPPPGTPPHEYHFQLFALDTTLDLGEGARRDELVEAMRDHVIGVETMIAPFGVSEAMAENPDEGG